MYAIRSYYALEAAREFGVDLEPHRASIVTDAMVRDAELEVSYNFV